MADKRNPRKFIFSRFLCPVCNEVNPLPIVRHRGAERERNHVKHVWCPTCKDTTPHKELTERERLLYEAKLGWRPEETLDTGSE